MYRVIVADDERHVVDWVTDLLTVNFPDLELQRANNGIEALELAEQCKVDMAVLDIKMPVVNGIETARKILERYPNCKILLLTGYDEFDLIYQVNNEKNIRYALKTETDGEIINKIKSILDEIEQELHTRQTVDMANRKSRLIQHFEWRSMLSDILFESESSQTMEEKIKFYRDDLPLNPDRPLNLAVIQFPGGVSSRQTITNLLLLQLYQTLEENMGALFRFAVLDLERDSVLLLAQSVRETEVDKSVAMLRSELDRSMGELLTDSNRRINFFVSGKTSSWQETVTQYNIILQYARSYVVKSMTTQVFGTVIQPDFDSANRHSLETTQYNASQLIQKLSFALSQGRPDEFHQLLGEMVEIRQQLAKMSISRQAELCAQLSLVALNYINQHGLRPALEQNISLSPLYRSMQVPNWGTLLDYVKYLSDEIFTLSSKKAENDSAHTVEAMCEYIDAHLADDLGVTKLADVFNYNQSYISRLFKQVKGENLSQYIKSARLNKAKSLLKSTDLPVGDIAAQVGFDTAQYFSMVFRRETGTTPKSFRSST